MNDTPTIIVSATNAVITINGNTTTTAKGTTLYNLAQTYVDAANTGADGDYLAGVCDEMVLEAARKQERERIGTVTYDGVTYYFKDQPIAPELGKMMFTADKSSSTFKALVAFIKNVSRNPKRDIYEELYDFLAVGDMPITEDGCFLAYKKVKEDYRDFHTGKVDYTVGNTVQMPAFETDDNRNQTCSRGLHFCSKSYLPYYHGSSGRIVIVKVNPADVAAIPTDYQNAKGRCWAMEVVGELDKGEADQIFRPLTEVADENGWLSMSDYDYNYDIEDDYYADEDEDDNPYGMYDDEDDDRSDAADEEYQDLLEQFEGAVETLLSDMGVNSHTIDDFLNSTELWKFAAEAGYTLNILNDDSVATTIRAFRMWRKANA